MRSICRKAALSAAIMLVLSGCSVSDADIEHWKHTQRGPRKITTVLVEGRYEQAMRVHAARALIEMKHPNANGLELLQGAFQSMSASDREPIVHALVGELQGMLNASGGASAQGPTEQQIKAKDVETQQAVFEMERQEKAAEYRALREMATTKAREESLTAQVEAEERQKAEQARLKTDETIGIQQENMQREVQVAATARERVLAAEKEKVEKARQLEVVARDIETLAATKDLESEKARVAELAKVKIE